MYVGIKNTHKIKHQPRTPPSILCKKGWTGAWEDEELERREYLQEPALRRVSPVSPARPTPDCEVPVEPDSLSAACSLTEGSQRGPRGTQRSCLGTPLQ